MSENFIAEVRAYPYQFAPQNWADCGGQILPISQNTALYSLIGTFYGGDGRATFGLPWLSGRAPIGSGSGPGLTTQQVGEFTGVEGVTLLESQMPAHTHSSTFENEKSDVPTPNGNYIGSLGTPSNQFAYGPPAALQPMHPGSLATTGSNQSHENRQPFLALRFCIALEGIYPSRN